MAFCHFLVISYERQVNKKKSKGKLHLPLLFFLQPHPQLKLLVPLKRGQLRTCFYFNSTSPLFKGNFCASEAVSNLFEQCRAQPKINKVSGAKRRRVKLVETHQWHVSTIINSIFSVGFGMFC